MEVARRNWLSGRRLSVAWGFHRSFRRFALGRRAETEPRGSEQQGHVVRLSAMKEDASPAILCGTGRLPRSGRVAAVGRASASV
jgi:hypothetical protein